MTTDMSDLGIWSMIDLEDLRKSGDGIVMPLTLEDVEEVIQALTAHRAPSATKQTGDAAPVEPCSDEVSRARLKKLINRPDLEKSQPTSENNNPMPPKQTDGWRPIETAPRDGTDILAFGLKRAYLTDKIFMCRVRHDEMDGYWRDEQGYRVHPSHWQPLPAPPSVNDGKEGA